MAALREMGITATVVLSDNPRNRGCGICRLADTTPELRREVKKLLSDPFYHIAAQLEE